MMGAKIYTAKILGLTAKLISVSISIERGLPSFSVIGIPQSATKRVRDTVISQLKRLKISVPQSKIKIQLSENISSYYADGLSLPICFAVVKAVLEKTRDSKHNYQLPQKSIALFGGVDILGNCTVSTGWNQFISTCLDNHQLIDQIIVPKLVANYHHSQVKLIEIEHFDDLLFLKPTQTQRKIIAKQDSKQLPKTVLSFNSIKKQAHVKLALTRALAGFHDIYISGAIGVGKSELAKIAMAGFNNSPFRKLDTDYYKYLSAFGEYQIENYITPTTTKSEVLDIISHSHKHIVVVEELPEIKEAIKQIIKSILDGNLIKVAGNFSHIRPLFIFTGNSCPCGYLGASDKECHCSPVERIRFKKRVSNQLLNRISIHITASDPISILKVSKRAVRHDLNRVNYSELLEKAYDKTFDTDYGNQHKYNGLLSYIEVANQIKLDEIDSIFLIESLERLKLNRRDYTQVIKLAQTICDTKGSNQISRSDLIEALSYRPRIT